MMWVSMIRRKVRASNKSIKELKQEATARKNQEELKKQVALKEREAGAHKKDR